MTALAKTEPLAEVTDYGSGLLGVIDRALGNPDTGVETLERLFALQERVMASSAKQQFTAAKIAMRPELPEVTMKGAIRIVKDGKLIQETPFARFEDIHDAVVPVLTAHGFDLAFRNGLSPDGKVRVTTILSHVGGHSEETEFDLPHDSSGSKNSVQAVGSSTSYGKRYGVLSALNIKVAGEDDDGTAASYKDPSGEPLPRTKLDGPIESKTALKAAIQAIRYNVDACPDKKALDELLKAEKAVIDQAARDWDALLTGMPNVPEDVGLKGDVAKRREYFKNDGGMFAALLKSMRECDTPNALTRWRAANEEIVDALDGAEGRQFQRAWDEHEATLANKPTILNG